MDIINFFVIIAFFINLTLSIFLFFHAIRTKSITVKYFSYFAISVTAWCISIFFYRSVNQESVVLWARVLYCTASFTPSTFLLFSLSFKDKDVHPLIVNLTYSLNVTLVFLILFSSLFISKVIIPETGERIIQFGNLYYWIYALYIPIIFTISFIFLIYKTLKSKSIEKNQLILILLGSVSTSTLAMITNLTLPSFGNFDFNWFGQVSTIIWLSAVSYSIVKYSLFDIRILIGRITYYLILGSISYFVYYVFSFISIQLFGGIYEIGSYIIGIVNAAIFVIFFDGLRKFIQEQIDSNLINPGFDPREVANDFNRKVSTELDYRNIIDATISVFSKTLRTSYEGVLVTPTEGKYMLFDGSKTMEFNKDIISSAIIVWKATGLHPIVIDEIESAMPAEFKEMSNWLTPIITEMKKVKLEVLAPLGQQKEILAILMIGEKDGDAPYNSTDVKFIDSIIDSASLAMTRSFLYSEVKDLNENLQKRIDIATEELKDKNDKLEVAFAKLEEVRRQERDMIDVMGHELRTPITIVRNALLVLDGLEKLPREIDKTTLRNYLDMAVEGARREIALIETLLSATKVDANKLQVVRIKVDLLDVINDSIVAFGKTADDKGLKINYKKPSGEYFVFADRIRIQEVMDNLFSNAVKYTQKGSVTIDIHDNKDKFKVSITDTGIGIAKEDLPNLGKKFFRAKQYTKEGEEGIVRPGGTGLGLYVVIGLIDQMQGEFDIKSEVGKGSTFSFSIPKYVGQKEESNENKFKHSRISNINAKFT